MIIKGGMPTTATNAMGGDIDFTVKNLSKGNEILDENYWGSNSRVGAVQMNAAAAQPRFKRFESIEG